MNRTTLDISYFTAPWCVPCKVYKPIVTQVRQELADENLEFWEINIDENTNLAESWGVMSVPTIVIHKDGHEVGRVIGAQSKTSLINEIKKYL